VRQLVSRINGGVDEVPYGPRDPDCGVAGVRNDGV
jgi:hypothetical protein